MKGCRTFFSTGLALALLVVSGAAAGLAADDKTKKSAPDAEPPALKVPAVFDKSAPDGLADLEAIQVHVKKVVKQVSSAVVGIQIGGASGSGVIIDEEGHVLTAGHVSGAPNNEKCVVIMPDGEKVKAKSLGRNGRIDSGLIKITGKLKNDRKFPYVSMGDSTKLKKSQWVISIGHPGGFKPTRTPVVRLGRILESNSNLVRSDCTLVGGDSGGPLFDMAGRVVGIHSRIGQSIDENVHVPVNTYRDTWDRLVASESFGGFADMLRPRRSAPSGVKVYLGVTLEPETLRVDEVTEGAPAAQAGLKAGDVIVGMDGTKLGSRGDLFDFLKGKSPDDEVTVTVQRDDKEVKLKLKLGKKPTE